VIGIDAGLGQSFLVAAAELGMCGAAWLFAREVAAQGGDAGIDELRDRLGRDFPVLDAVCARWLAGQRAARIDPDRVVAHCRGARRLLVVGLEADFLDALVARLRGIELALLTHDELDADWERVLANYRDRVVGCSLGSFQRYAGAAGVLLTFVYGFGGEVAHVAPAWLRVIAGDVRTQFRSLVGWDVLGGEMYVYPRWLVQAPVADFSHIV
jgi:hypothetical protein